jgi:DNA-binding MarR family transcriptional regulator
MNEKHSKILTEFFEQMSSWEDGIVRDTEISLPQMHLIEVVGNHGKLRMKELSEKLGVTTGTLTVMVHRLTEKCLIKRERDPEDKRSYFITLDIKGNEEYRHHHNMHAHLIEEINAELGEDKTRQFFRMMEQIQSIM